MTFHDFQVFHALRFSCHFQKSSKLSLFEHIFDLKQFNSNKLWYPPKCVLLMLSNYSSLSYIILPLSNLPNKTLIFHDFQGPKTKFHDLCEPCNDDGFLLGVKMISFVQQKIHFTFKSLSKLVLAKKMINREV